MNTRVFFDDEINQDLLSGRKIAVIGYGAQGTAHALNLRDSGMDVVVGQRPGARFKQAVADGLRTVSIEQACQDADFICLMLPDEVQGAVFQSAILPHLNEGDIVLCCHGFSLLYETVKPPQGVVSLLVAPKGAGHRVRSAYEAGVGVPCLVSVGPAVDREQHLPMALSYASAIGGGRAGIIETTVREETETDLFGEQAVLCGGVSHLAVAAFETLVDAGYREEVAYFECIHELKLVVDLLYRGGLAFMRDHISNTAEYGDYVTGPRLVDEHVKERLKEVLADIQSGRFARDWIQETNSGGERFQQFRKDHQQKSVEKTSAEMHRRLKLT